MYRFPFHFSLTLHTSPLSLLSLSLSLSLSHTLTHSLIKHTGVLSCSPANGKRINSIIVHSTGFICGCDHGVVLLFDKNGEDDSSTLFFLLFSIHLWLVKSVYYVLTIYWEIIIKYFHSFLFLNWKRYTICVNENFNCSRKWKGWGWWKWWK